MPSTAASTTSVSSTATRTAATTASTAATISSTASTAADTASTTSTTTSTGTGTASTSSSAPACRALSTAPAHASTARHVLDRACAWGLHSTSGAACVPRWLARWQAARRLARRTMAAGDGRRGRQPDTGSHLQPHTHTQHATTTTHVITAAQLCLLRGQQPRWLQCGLLAGYGDGAAGGAAGTAVCTCGAAADCVAVTTPLLSTPPANARRWR